MQTTPTAKALMSAPETLPALLTGFSETMLDDLEAWCKAIISGRNIRISHHTPRGRVLSENLGKRVLSAVRSEQTRRCGF